ncbi:hypothetical protein PHLCEN_2v8152, partial [Hermanssonia centrifuga]
PLYTRQIQIDESPALGRFELAAVSPRMAVGGHIRHVSGMLLLEYWQIERLGVPGGLVGISAHSPPL